MRKGHEKLLDRAKNAHLEPEQLDALRNEALSLKALRALFDIFLHIPDFPLCEAVAYAKEQTRGKRELRIYDLCVGGAFDWKKGRFLTYAELTALPLELMDRPHRLEPYNVMWSKLSSSATEKLTFTEFVSMVDSYFGYTPRYPAYLVPEILNVPGWNGHEAGKTFNDVGFVMFSGKVWDMLLSQLETRCPEQYAAEYSRWGAREAPLSRYERVHILEKTVAGYSSAKDDYVAGRTPEEVVDGIYNGRFASMTPANVLDHIPEQTDWTAWTCERQKQEVQRILGDGLLTCKVVVRSYRYVKETVKFGIKLKFYHAESIDLNKNGVTGQYSLDHKKDTAFLLFDNWNLYQEIYVKKTQQTKLIPAQVGVFFSYLDKYDCESIRIALFDAEKVKEQLIFRDLWEDYQYAKKNDVLFPPIQWNSCYGCHNRNELARHVWKKADETINWNKLGLPRGYALMKSKPFVDEKSKNILENGIYTGEIAGAPAPKRSQDDSTDFYKPVGKNVAIYLVSDYLKKHMEIASGDSGIDESPTGEHTENTADVEILDYARGAARAGIALNMHQRSMRKLVDKNIHIAAIQMEKGAPVIRIPKNSRFNALRAMLPEDRFEWIRTKTRICREGAEMNHCVASYADYVNKDISAIYHLLYGGKDYTVEFRQNRKTQAYECRQIQSRSDRGAPKKVWDYVNSFIKGTAAAGA